MSIAARAIHGVNVCVIPSPYNNDRPLVLRHRSLATISAALLAIKALAILTVLLTPTPAQLSTITTARIIQLTNQEREKVGLAPLTANSALSAAAQDKGNNMLENDYFAHISPTGVTPWFWMAKHNYEYLVAGENLAIDFLEAEDVVAAWMASPSHKANIVHPDYTETGVAVATGEFQGSTSIVVVHMFGKPAIAQAQSESTPTPTPSPATAGVQLTSTPTPAPASSPSPTPTPLPALSSPRIALLGNTIIQDSIDLDITGNAGTEVAILVNGQLLADTLLESDNGQIRVDVSNVADGQLNIQAYASDPENTARSSDVSNLVTATKDTAGPSIAAKDITFVVGPTFDTPLAAAKIPQLGDASITVFDVRNPQAIEVFNEIGSKTLLENITLLPQFDDTATNEELVVPRRMVQLSRRIAAVVSVIVLALLGLAIIVRIRIQHPALITHASLVVMLAGILFLF